MLYELLPDMYYTILENSRRKAVYIAAVNIHNNHVAIFNYWRRMHPGVYISRSPYAQTLVLNMITSYIAMFQRSDDMEIDEVYLQYLYALLNEAPPPERDNIPQIIEKLSNGELIFYTQESGNESFSNIIKQSCAHPERSWFSWKIIQMQNHS